MTTFDDLFAVGAGREAFVLPAAPRTDERLLFGGLLLAQAIAAATLDGPRCHSIHALFVDVGWMDESFDVAVENLRQGRSFTMRRIEIRQRDRLLLAGFTSHHSGDAGPTRQISMPSVPCPDTLVDQRVARGIRVAAKGCWQPRYLAEELLDIRAADMSACEGEGRRALWFRPRAKIRGGAAIHQSAIAFASDVGLVHVGLQTHGLTSARRIQSASLDHALWFHRDAVVDDWMLQLQTSPTLADGRGFSRSSIFTRDGRLVATASQEYLARNKIAPS